MSPAELSTDQGAAMGPVVEVRSSAVRTTAPLTARLLLRTTQLLRRSHSLDLLGDISQTPWLTREQILAMQWQRLSALLEHAQARVPYYREMFRTLGVKPREVRNLKDFASLPVLTKDIIRERQKDLLREDVPFESLQPHHSGGSTGIPLTFYRERSYVDASEAGTFRNWMESGWQPGEMVAFFWGGNERLARMPSWQFRLRQAFRRMYQFDSFRSGFKDMEEWLRVWPSLDARIAHGYASTIARFAEHVEETGRRLPPLRGVFTTAEKLFPQQRAAISRVFNCPVFDCYGSSEVQNIAAECRSGKMHVNADFVVLEQDVGDVKGAHAPRPFLVTSLWNYAMPFIRYRNEDCGSLVNDTCDCGNNFPLMELNIARVSDNFILPDGRVVHGEFFTHLMYGSEGIANFQFHQTATDAITLWVVPRKGSLQGPGIATSAAIEQIRTLSSGITVDVRETDLIPLSTNGKHRFTRSDVAIKSARRDQ